MPTPRENDPRDELPAILAACEACPPALDELTRLYGELDRLQHDDQQLCLGGGACCRFDLAGHRLYVSGLELALLMTQPPRGESQPLRCPYQAGPRCTARDVRPLGCRTFFCRKAGGSEDYERGHAEIRRIHDRHDLPYVYREMTQALRDACSAEDKVLR